MAPFFKYVVTSNVTRSYHCFDGAFAVVLALEHATRVWSLGALLDHRYKLPASVTAYAVLL